MIETMVRADNTAQSWHGLENLIPHDSPFDAWFDASGLNFEVRRSVVSYLPGEGQAYKTMDNRHVLFRSDTQAPLSVVGEDYKVVQPREVLEFYRNLCDENKLVMDTAGVLAGGKRVWALARTNNAIAVGGSDVVKQYILLATSYDTTMATIAKPTSVRVVCNNTLTMAYNNAEAAIRVNHCTEFDKTRVQLDMGLLDDALEEFSQYANEMHKFRYSDINTAARWYAELLKERPVSDDEFEDLMDNRVLRGLMNSYARSPGAEPTLWGVVNGCTYMVDHVRGRGYDTRMNSAWFGQGDLLKRKAWEKAKQVIDAANDSSLLLAA
jgi:phage/plasmid-like protein (TIGR03299 family)